MRFLGRFNSVKLIFPLSLFLFTIIPSIPNEAWALRCKAQKGSVAKAALKGGKCIKKGVKKGKRPKVSTKSGASRTTSNNNSVPLPEMSGYSLVPLGTPYKREVGISFKIKPNLALGFEIDRRLVKPSEKFKKITSFTDAAHHGHVVYTDSKVVGGEIYEYKISAYNSKGTVTSDSLQIIVPADVNTPINPPAVFSSYVTSSGQVVLNWSKAAGYNTGYRIEGSTDYGEHFIHEFTLDSSQTSIEFKLPNSTDYNLTYRICTLNGVTNSDYMVTSVVSESRKDPTTPLNISWSYTERYRGFYAAWQPVTSASFYILGLVSDNKDEKWFRVESPDNFLNSGELEAGDYWFSVSACRTDYRCSNPSNPIRINIPKAKACQNPFNNYDVNSDLVVNKADGDFLIEFINTYGSGKISIDSKGYCSHAFLDVNGDGEINPLDVVILVAYLGQ